MGTTMPRNIPGTGVPMAELSRRGATTKAPEVDGATDVPNPDGRQCGRRHGRTSRKNGERQRTRQHCKSANGQRSKLCERRRKAA